MHDLFVVVGASGSGKTTIVKAVAGEDERYKHHQVQELTRIVTCTSRDKREGEREGVDYYFIGQEGFSGGGFIEQATYKGTTYGLRERDVWNGVKRGPGIIIMEVQGARQLIDWNRRERGAETFLCYMRPLPLEILAQRMRDRGDQPDAIQKRLAGVEKEYEGIQALVRSHVQSYAFSNEHTPEASMHQLKRLIEFLSC